MKPVKLHIVIPFLIIGQLLAFSQTKDEREERITIKKFPEAAIDIIDNLPKDCKKLKYYRETDGSRRSFEVKFKYKKQRYSLEFNPEGIVEDIEITIDYKDLKKKIKSEINDYFDENFKKTRIIKTQKQFVFSGSKNASKFVEHVLKNKTKLFPNYEIIAEVRSDSKRLIKEFTFNSAGKIIDSRDLNPSSYEHVLY